MNCPCNYDIPDEKLCAGQLAWRHGYEDCVDGVEPEGFPNIMMQSLCNTWLNVNACHCVWCKSLVSRYAGQLIRETPEYFDCHDGLNAQCRIDDARDSNKDESSFRLRECDCCR